MPIRPPRKPRSSSKKYTVFISHSTADLFIAKTIAEKIKACGAQVWLDVLDLEGGAPLKSQILEGMRVSREVVVLLSPKSVTSPWVIYETGLAESRGRRVTPILVNVAYDAIPTLKDLKAIDLNDFDSYLSQLKKRIKQFKRKRPQRVG